MTGTLENCKSLTPIIKAVGDFCNLRCTYCFYSRQDQSRRTVMSQDVLESFLKQYLELFAGPAHFIWHGGEPLLAGIPFYERVVALQQHYSRTGQTVENLIQTNATLITDEWAQFFQNQGFRVGVSIDGDALAHDAFRVDSSGAGSFSRVMGGVEMLKKNKIPFGVILVLTAGNAGRLGSLVNFLVQQTGTRSISINTFEDGAGYSRAMMETVKCGQLADGIQNCLENWPLHEEGNLRLREVDSFVAGALGRKSRACSFNGGCRNYFCLNYDGEIYPCDNFTNLPEMRLGNLAEESLSAILEGPARSTILSQFEAIHPECGECEWQPVCHNGCPAHRRGGIHGKLALCQDRKVLFSRMKDLIRDQPADILDRHPQLTSGV